MVSSTEQSLSMQPREQGDSGGRWRPATKLTLVEHTIVVSGVGVTGDAVSSSPRARTLARDRS